MKLIIQQPGGTPLEIEIDRVRVLCGQDQFVMREQPDNGNDASGAGLLLRLEEHDGALSLDLAVFPHGANTVRLKGGLR